MIIVSARLSIIEISLIVGQLCYHRAFNEFTPYYNIVSNIATLSLITYNVLIIKELKSLVYTNSTMMPYVTFLLLTRSLCIIEKSNKKDFIESVRFDAYVGAYWIEYQGL